MSSTTAAWCGYRYRMPPRSNGLDKYQVGWALLMGHPICWHRVSMTTGLPSPAHIRMRNFQSRGDGQTVGRSGTTRKLSNNNQYGVVSSSAKLLIARKGSSLSSILSAQAWLWKSRGGRCWVAAGASAVLPGGRSLGLHIINSKTFPTRLHACWVPRAGA